VVAKLGKATTTHEARTTDNMKAPSSDTGTVSSSPQPPSLLRRFAQAWDRFWFTPADPTTLGLIRICCGMIALYTFVVYSFQFQEFFGEKAWFDLKTRRAIVDWTPNVSPELGWEQTPPPEPTNEAQRAYREYYFKRWGQYPPAPYPTSDQEAKWFDEYQREWGGDPRLTSSMGTPVWSIWFHVTDPEQMKLVHIGFILITFFFMVGFCTRITSVLTWWANLCYIHRNPAVLFGVDTMMNITMIYLMIGPSGAALSVDRLLSGWWRRRREGIVTAWKNFWGRLGASLGFASGASSASTPAGAGKASADPKVSPASSTATGPAPMISANFVIRLLQIHLCFIYGASGLSKLQGQSWWRGTAIWGTLANFEFAPMQFQWYNDVLRLLSLNRTFWEVFMTLGAFFTLFFEVGYPFLIWYPRTRWLMLFMAVILHGLIGLFMGLKTFSLMMLTMNLALLPPATIHWFLGKIGFGPLAKPPAPTTPESQPRPAPPKSTAFKPSIPATTGRTPVKPKS
jgi:hypothetical protein